MKKKSVLIFIIFLISSGAYACDCANVFNNSFLGNTKRFDFIVKGKIEKMEFDFLTYIIEETYKGEIKGDTIILANGFNCDNLLTFKPGDKIITGLYALESPNYPNTYASPGCITSAIYIKGQQVFAPEHQLPMYHKPKIALFRSRMSLKAFERKLRRRVAP